MNISAMKYLCAIYEEKSLTKAADRLFISKQGLSQIVKRAEDELKVSLFERSKNGIRATDDGEKFYATAIKMIKIWDEYENTLSFVSNRIETLNVGYGYMSGNLWTDDMASQFSHLNPTIQINTQIGPSKEMLHLLDQGQIDLLVTSKQQDKYDKYQVFPMKISPIHVILNDNDILASRDSIQPEDLSGRLLCFPESGAAYLESFIDYLSRLGVGSKGQTLPSGNFMNQLKFVRSHDALLLTNNTYKAVISELPGYCNTPFVAPAEHPAPEMSINALALKERSIDNGMKAFIRFFKTSVPHTFED